MKSSAKKDQSKSGATTQQSEIEKHLSAAKHLEELANHHLESAKQHRKAAKHYEKGEIEKALEYATQAHKHELIAPVYNPEDLKQHAANWDCRADGKSILTVLFPSFSGQNCDKDSDFEWLV